MPKGMQSGKLITWKDERGFGFIKPSHGQQDIFIHISAIQESTRRPKIGDTICYYTVVKDGKLSARNAFIVGARQKSNDAKTVATRQSLARFPWEVFPLSGFPVGCSLFLFLNTLIVFPLVLYPVMSLIAFFAYADDKNRAQMNRWRTPESTLHLLEILGGWPGALIAQKQLRHKSKKANYQFIYWIIVVFHYVVWVIWLVSLLGQ